MNRKITIKIILIAILFLLTVSCFSKSVSSNIPINVGYNKKRY